MSILETVGAIIVGLLLIGAAAFGLYSAFGKSNVATMEQNLVLLRMQTQQFFFGTNYDNLDNEVAIKAGIVPKKNCCVCILRSTRFCSIVATLDLPNAE